MFKLKILFCFIILIFFGSCSKEVSQKSIIKEKSLELQVKEAYKEGIEALNNGDVLFAAKKFNEAEILFPQADSAPQSALMAAYSYYTQDYYGDAIAELERFLKVYPSHKDLGYAYYLLGVCYYELIVDEKKDLSPLINSKKYFKIILKEYPNTDFALDAKFKIGLIENILASKEVYVGNYYLKKKKWIPALNRFKNVLDSYDQTEYVEEAMHRLVEINYILGLENEAKRYAVLLGYNYQSSQWYKESYRVFNKKYEDPKQKIKKNKQNIIIRKFKDLFK